MAHYSSKLIQAISETPMSQLLRILPAASYTYFDPTRETDKRMLINDSIEGTTLYVFKDRQEELKVFSSSDMSIISKDTLLFYLTGQFTLDALSNGLNRVSYPELPELKEKFSKDPSTESIFNLTIEDEDNFNIYHSVHGDTLPLTFNKKLNNLAFVNSERRSFTLMNQNPGLHHTLGLADAEKLLINFNPLLALQNDPDEYGCITVPIIDYQLHRYLLAAIDSIGQPVTYNLHTTSDYHHFLTFLLHTTGQINERLKLLSVEKEGMSVHFLVQFKTEINSIKKRGVGAKINSIYLEAFTHNEQTHSIEEKDLNLSERIKDKLFSLSTELENDLLRVSAVNSISAYKMVVQLFFGQQPISAIGNPV